MSSVDFQALVERAMQTGERTHMRPVVEKELLHYDILFALDQDNLLDALTFQGGTSLRLCYGAQRFSEDLDFAAGAGFDAKQLLPIRSCIERYIGDRYGFEVTVKEPKDLAADPHRDEVLVLKWQIRVVTAPSRPDLPKQMIKVVVAAIPAYTREPQTLRRNYDFLPDGYTDLIVLVESLDEIMADKLVALPNCTAYVRHRDVWDLHWLKQQGAQLKTDLVQRKVRDYHADDYEGKVASLIGRLPEIIHGKEFRDQMSRFIPADVQDRTLAKEKFLALLVRETQQMFEAVARGTGK